jgi:hypothetical protein
MATERLIAGSGVGLTWTSCFGTELNSLTSADSVLSSVQIDNTTALDMYADLCIQLASVTPGAGAPFLGFNLWPLNEDGSTYGTGQFTSKAAGQSFLGWIGNIPLIPSTAGVLVGVLSMFQLPPAKFKFVIYNGAGIALAASANTIYYRTYNIQVA